MFSTRTRNFEIINQEGLHRFHVAYGMNLLYPKGDDYRGTIPVWGWTLIPGTTAVHASKADGTSQTLKQGPVTAANPDQVPVSLLVSVGDQEATFKLTDGRSVSAKAN